MSEAQHLSFLVSLILFTVVFLFQASEVATLKAGKVNVTTKGPGLFACEQVSFAAPFTSGQEVKILASFGHALKRPTRGHGAALWLESIRNSGFRICVLEFGDGSNGTAEVNWIALQSAPSGAQTGTASLNSWATGTECTKIYFPQRFLTPPKILVTPSDQFPGRPQDAAAVWVEHLREESVNICARETKMFDGLHQNIKIQWLAFTSSGIENVTLTDSLVFASNNTSPLQKNFAVCQKVNFTNPFFAPPVVVVTPKRNSSSQSGSTGCDAITAWVEYTSVRETEICVKSYDSQKDVIRVDYVVVGDLDPCLNVTCIYHGLCKSFGPRDARCVCITNCPSYQEPICSSNGKSYDNICLFKREICGLQLNYTVQHPGSCEGFPFQRGRRHMPHIPTLGYSHCEVIPFSPYVFYPDKAIAVQITVNHIDTSDMSYVHDAAVSWVENVYYHQFTACVMAAGFNERKSTANVTVDWIAYQGAPVGGVAGEVRISQWWTGTTCETVNFPLGKFLVQPSVFVTAKHNNPGLKRDACSLWVEDITQTSCKICMRELQNYAGAHKDIYVNWMAFSYLHKPPFSEHNSIYFVNNRPPDAQHNDAYCKDVAFASVYNVTPHVFVSANHSTTGGNLSPVYNGITAWVEYINKTGFRVCFKELYGTRYDPLSVAYTVLSEICPSGWGYFNGYCYFTSSVCAAWLTAVSNCSAMGSQLVTVHNQEENVYIQHRHSGEKSWIGLNDRSVEGSFVWTNKEISSFRFWAPRQPNNWRNEDCVHALGARHGYTWNDVPCDNCYNFTCFKVIDECITNYHSCDVNAICQDTVGSYVCTCKAGYTGDGRSCFDIDECATSTHGCDVNAVCYNSVGSHACTCKTGFSGNGRICTDNDECSSNTHDCDVNAVCNNTVGSYNCGCKSGFTGNGTTCLFAFRSCAEVYKVGGSNVNGVYKIDPDGLGEFEVFCDQKTAGGGWTVFQRRQDGSVDFFRGWYDYKRGFGNLNGEFWLGLDKIHRLTVGGSNKLRVDLKDVNSYTAFAEYSSILVANEMAKYQLTLGSYGGTAGDSMSYHSGSKFTTKDDNNDRHGGSNCALTYKGAFWYNNCYYVNLNGKYQPGTSSTDGVVWYHWRQFYSLKKTEMKIRPTSF